MCGVKLLQGRVQSGGFAGARGTRHQHNAVRLRDELLKALQGRALHTHRGQRQAALRFVQQTKHRTFAVCAWQGRDPHIDGALPQTQRDTPVLRQALLSNVQVSHDLQAGNQSSMQSTVRLHHFAQGAVDTKTHTGVALIGLDVDVAGTVPCRLHQQGVQHADDGGVGRGFQQVFYGRQLLHHAGQIGFALDFTHHHGRTRLGTSVAGADALSQALRVELLKVVYHVHAQNLTPSARWRLRQVPQRQGSPIVLQQQLVRAGESVRQRVTHGASRL